MQKLQNYTLQRFLDYIIEELKRENEDRKIHDTKELDIPFIISSLWQSFNSRENDYKEFISELENYSEYNVIIENSKNDYDGIIDVFISLAKYKTEVSKDFFCDDYYDYPNYDYRLEFSNNERNWGYCECTPDMEDYREDKHCCGHECDASFCSFELHKVLHIIKDTWHGDEHDYWDFEDEFYADDKELADKKAAEDKKRMIKELKSRIEADSKKLAELECIEFPVDVNEEVEKYKKTLDFMNELGI